MGTSALFVGGPLDGLRKTYPNDPPPREDALTFNPYSVFAIEGSELPTDAPTYTRTTYRLERYYDGEGRTQFMYFVRSISQPDDVRALKREIAALKAKIAAASKSLS